MMYFRFFILDGISMNVELSGEISFLNQDSNQSLTNVLAVMVLFMVMPFMLTAFTFLIYMAVHGNDLNNQLSVVSLFMTMSLYGILQVPLGFLPMLINFFATVRLCIYCTSLQLQ